jgi:hypothetical protein
MAFLAAATLAGRLPHRVVRCARFGYIREWSGLCRLNKSTREPYENIYIAFELVEQAYKAHGLSYKSGQTNLGDHPPGPFTWFCDKTADANHCVKARDDESGRVVIWPDWP